MKRTKILLIIILALACISSVFAGCTEMYVYCGNNKLEAELADNPSAKALAEQLRKGDITFTVNDYGDFEKVGDTGYTFPQTNVRFTTGPGDIILWQGNQISFYYDENSWNFTYIGSIAGATRESMLEFFGGYGQKSVTLSLK